MLKQILYMFIWSSNAAYPQPHIFLFFFIHSFLSTLFFNVNKQLIYIITSQREAGKSKKKAGVQNINEHKGLKQQSPLNLPTYKTNKIRANNSLKQQPHMRCKIVNNIAKQTP